MLPNGPIIDVPRAWFLRLRDMVVDLGEAVFAKLYYWRAADPPPTYTAPLRRNPVDRPR